MSQGLLLQAATYYIGLIYNMGTFFLINKKNASYTIAVLFYDDFYELAVKPFQSIGCKRLYLEFINYLSQET